MEEEKLYEDKLDKIAMYMEKMKIAEYVEYLNKPSRLIYVNFIAGVSRGFGIAIGFTILGALLFLLLQKLMFLNIPFIGDFIAEIVEYVQENRGIKP